MTSIRTRLLSVTPLLTVLALSCSVVAPPEATPTPSSTATATRVPPTRTPTPTPTPTPSPTPIPDIEAGQGIVVGGELRTRAEPTTASEQKGTLQNLQQVSVVRTMKGENWLKGAQTWFGASPGWATDWHQLEDGTFIYAAFVFVLREGETSPFATLRSDEERWIDVDISEQRARAMVGDDVVFEARVSTGAPPFDTPKGSFEVQPDGRIAVEKMTAAQAGYAPDQAQYDVERVLFTQYFDQSGNALHMNYWRPSTVFGRTRTSHGCVGMEMHDAQYFWLFGAAGTRVEVHD